MYKIILANECVYNVRLQENRFIYADDLLFDLLSDIK